MTRRFSALLATLALVAACGGDDNQGETGPSDDVTAVDTANAETTNPDVAVQDDAEAETEAPDADEPETSDAEEDSASDTEEDSSGDVDTDASDDAEEDADQDPSTDTPDDASEDASVDAPEDGEDDASEDAAADAAADVGCEAPGRVSFDETLELWTRVGDPLPVGEVAPTIEIEPCGSIVVLSDVTWLSGQWVDGVVQLELIATPPAGIERLSLTLVDQGARQVAGRLDIVWRALPQLRPDMTPHVLWIGIDGMRADTLYAASTPVMDRLRDGGAWTYDGSTHLSTSTDSAAGWTALFTGVDSDKHLVLNNGTLGERDWAWPTAAQLVRDAGHETAVYAHWAPITNDIHEDTAMTRQGNGSDDDVRDQAIAELQRGLDTPPARLVVLHLDDVDHAGHATGFTVLNPAYVSEIEAQDARIGLILDGLLDRVGIENEDWMVFVVTDHGGEGTSHGAENLPNWRIPLMQWGTSVAPGRFNETVFHMDIAPTVLAHLGVASELDFDGRPMASISRTPDAAPRSTETTCDDRIDEDGDRLFDCDDPDCDSADICAPVCADREADATSGVIASGNNSTESTDYSLTCARLPGGRDVGVSFVAPSEATYRFDTLGTEFDTILAVYDGACAAPSGQLDCDDDGGEGLLSQIDIALSEGQEVTVVIAGFDGLSGEWVLNASVLE